VVEGSEEADGRNGPKARNDDEKSKIVGKPGDG
jgi:hypothetical protein